MEVIRFGLAGRSLFGVEVSRFFRVFGGRIGGAMVSLRSPGACGFVFVFHRV